MYTRTCTNNDWVYDTGEDHTINGPYIVNGGYSVLWKDSRAYRSSRQKLCCHGGELNIYMQS